MKRRELLRKPKILRTSFSVDFIIRVAGFLLRRAGLQPGRNKSLVGALAPEVRKAHLAIIILFLDFLQLDAEHVQLIGVHA
jgi:hypothetical protein